MATRSSIAIKNDDGSITGVYCHNDGYPSWNGRILVQSYAVEAKVRQLIALGNLSSLAAECTLPPGHSFDNRVDGYTVAYGRDRAETDVDAVTCKDYKTFARKGVQEEYNYLFEDGIWTVDYDGDRVPVTSFVYNGTWHDDLPESE